MIIFYIIAYVLLALGIGCLLVAHWLGEHNIDFVISKYPPLKIN